MFDTSLLEVSSVSEIEVPDADEELVAAPPRAGVERVKAGEPWGTGAWRLSVHAKDGEVWALGATCECHKNAGDNRVCKKFVTLGTSGVSAAEMTVRLKRWLVAGLESDDWEGGGIQRQHVAVGGRSFLAELSEGIAEADLNRIANAQAPRA